MVRSSPGLVAGCAVLASSRRRDETHCEGRRAASLGRWDSGASSGGGGWFGGGGGRDKAVAATATAVAKKSIWRKSLLSIKERQKMCTLINDLVDLDRFSEAEEQVIFEFAIEKIVKLLDEDLTPIHWNSKVTPISNP
jgi:hypothetical protein